MPQPNMHSRAQLKWRGGRHAARADTARRSAAWGLKLQERLTNVAEEEIRTLRVRRAPGCRLQELARASHSGVALAHTAVCSRRRINSRPSVRRTVMRG